VVRRQILQNDELMMKNERHRVLRVASKQRKRALKDKAPGKEAQREAMASLIGTQDNMLNLIESLSFLPPSDDDPTQGRSRSGSPTERSRPKGVKGGGAHARSPVKSPDEARAHRDAVGARLEEYNRGDARSCPSASTAAAAASSSTSAGAGGGGGGGGYAGGCASGYASRGVRAAASVCATPRATTGCSSAATATAPRDAVSSAAPTRPRPTAAEARPADAAGAVDLSSVASTAFGVPATLPATASRVPGRFVEASSVSIARRPVPVIAWSHDRGAGAAGGTTPGRCASAHSRLAAFEGRFGAPDRLREYGAGDGAGDGADGEFAEPGAAEGDGEPPAVCVRNAWPHE
jgi:hypothetical protein